MKYILKAHKDKKWYRCILTTKQKKFYRVLCEIKRKIGVFFDKVYLKVDYGDGVTNEGVYDRKSELEMAFKAFIEK